MFRGPRFEALYRVWLEQFNPGMLRMIEEHCPDLGG